jgi:hypothetical protein
MRRRQFLQVSVGLGTAVAAKAGVKAPQQPSPFLRREGIQLLLNGQSFGCITQNLQPPYVMGIRRGGASIRINLEPIPKTPIKMEVCRYETRLRRLERSPRRRTS